MKFGVREIANVVFKAKSNMKIGNTTFNVGDPVLYIDSAKTTSMEGAATTVYATGGRGNTRLLAWEGEKTLTVTVEDALLSPIGFSILSGAGLFGQTSQTVSNVHVHRTAYQIATTSETTGKVSVDLTGALGDTESILSGTNTDDITKYHIMKVDADDSIVSSIASSDITVVSTSETVSRNVGFEVANTALSVGDKVFVDFYVSKATSVVTELQIDAEHFGGYFYVEADTLFRRKSDGKDLPAILTYPQVKIQSNFTFSMASSGDPSTFTFTMDAMPDYTYFDKTKKVLCVMQIVDEAELSTGGNKEVMYV